MKLAISAFLLLSAFIQYNYGSGIIKTINYHFGSNRRILQTDLLTPPIQYTNITCSSNRDCPNGICDNGLCDCNKCFFHDPNSDIICGIEHYSIIAAFLITFFIGGCGIDHCILSGCTCPGVCIGITKALTVGGFVFWTIADWILIGTGDFNNHYPENYKQICKTWP
jgi:hypothetical protein